MRIVFCGSGEFGIPTLQQLVDQGMDLPLVLTQPPRPAGRGGQLRPTPLAQEAGQLGLAVRAVEDINAPEVVEALGGLAPGGEGLRHLAGPRIVHRQAEMEFRHGVQVRSFGVDEFVLLQGLGELASRNR